MFTFYEVLSDSNTVICQDCNDAIAVSDCVWINDYILCRCCGNESEYDLKYLRSCINEIFEMKRHRDLSKYYSETRLQQEEKSSQKQTSQKKTSKSHPTHLPELPPLPRSPKTTKP